MNFKPLLTALPAGLLCLSVSACDKGDELRPIQTDTALRTANQHMSNALDTAARTGARLEGMDLIDQLLGGSDNCAPQTPGGPVDCGSGGPNPEDLDEVADEIEGRIFDEANLEIAEETRITLRLRSEVVCLEEVGGNPARMDEECAAILDAVPIRLELTSTEEDALDVRILIGENRLAPFTLALRPTGLSVDLDLGPAFESARILTEAAGEDFSEVPITTLSGGLRFAVQVPSDQEIVADISATSAIELRGSVEGEPIRLALASGARLFHLHLNGAEQTILAETETSDFDLELPLNLVAGDDASACVSIPGEAPCDPPEPAHIDGTLAIHVPGSTGSLRIDTSSEVHTSWRSTGAIQVAVDGMPILTLDANADSGRALDAIIDLANEEAPILRVSPLLHLVADARFEHIADRVEVPEALLNDRMEIRLDGADQPAVRFLPGIDSEAPPLPGEPPVEPAPPAPVLEVLAGNLFMQANGRSVTVSAGECLLEEPASSEEPDFLNLTSGSCE